MRKLLPLILLIAIAGVMPARAQSAATVSLYALDASAFPAMSALLDVYDAAGNFVSGLTPASVTLLEDNRTRSPDTLEELHPGAQFVLALDPGPDFALRDSNGISRLDKVLAALREWAATIPANTSDDLSLIATGGATSTHLATSGAFSDALSAYKPDARALTPTLDTLSRALDAASEPNTQPGMKRAVLFVTSVPERTSIPTLQSLAARAQGLGIRVFVWIVVSTDYFSTSGATALKDLAIMTGGGYALFSGAEPLPSPETYLTPLRHGYALSYTSDITTPGNHTLAVQVSVNGNSVPSAPLSFDMDVQPPNPILVSPPQQIVRQIPDARSTDLAALRPENQEIDVIIEFPDGHPRPLARTSLYVDGQEVARNVTAPFDKFVWNLSAYTSSGQHSIQVEAVDSLGLSKVSLGTTVTVTVVQPKRGLAAFLARNSLWVALGAVLIAGLSLGIILVAGRTRRRAGKPSRGSKKDPLTQPVVAETNRRNLRLPWASQVKASAAYLVRLKDDGQPVTAPPIPIASTETIFGTDPLHATHILDDPSVSPLHARLRQEADGTFTLSDEKSVAGTWVNYEQLHEPRRLQHGDVLHMGRLSYRFMLRKPPERPKLRLTPSKS